ncbi:hypothetical protein JBE27_26555 [Streptomyces albiflaviniger]|nr:hypothetical protein [Streptomyces albiflaviniger]
MVLHPERVTSLVLSGTVGGLADADHLEVQARCVTPELTSLPWHLSELSAGYRALTTPILLLVGTADLLTPPALMRYLARHLIS